MPQEELHDCTVAARVYESEEHIRRQSWDGSQGAYVCCMPSANERTELRPIRGLAGLASLTEVLENEEVVCNDILSAIHIQCARSTSRF